MATLSTTHNPTTNRSAAIYGAIERGRRLWQRNNDEWYSAIRECITWIRDICDIIHSYYGPYYYDYTPQNVTS
jgi:uncharacterized protein YjcR